MRWLERRGGELDDALGTSLLSNLERRGGELDDALCARLLSSEGVFFYGRVTLESFSLVGSKALVGKRSRTQLAFRTSNENDGSVQ